MRTPPHLHMSTGAPDIAKLKSVYTHKPFANYFLRIVLSHKKKKSVHTCVRLTSEESLVVLSGEIHVVVSQGLLLGCLLKSLVFSPTE